MHIAKIFGKCAIQILIIGLLLSTVSYAQTASATWALTADTASVVTGSVSAPAQVLCKTPIATDTLAVKDYTGSTAVGAAERVWLNGTNWPQESSKNTGRYLQYSISPDPNHNLTVQSITLNLGCSGSNTNMYASIACSIDSTFTTSTELYPPTLLVDIRPVGSGSGTFAALSFTPGAFIDSGQTFYMRVYPWWGTNSGPSATKYVCLTNVIISGITTSYVSPSLAAFPDSIDFGETNVNTTRGYKTLIVSGTNFLPESDSIRLIAPDGFILSASSDSGYSSYLALPYTSGTLGTTTVYAKFLPTLVQSYSGIISVEGGGATAQNVAVTGTGVPADYPIGIFVSTTGNDTSAGNFNAPFRTIQKAMSVAQPGDTIFVRGGHYIMDTITVGISASGNSTALRCLIGYSQDSERPLLDFSAMPWGRRGILLTGNYWHIKGLDVYKAGDNGMRISGSNNIIEYCSFFENQGTGLQLTANASNNQIINCDSYFNFDSLTTDGGGNPTPGANADGFAPKQMTGVNNYFYGCRAWQNSDDGWDCFEAVASVTLENCWTWSNGYLKDGSDPGTQANGNGFKMGGNYTDNDADLLNCLAFSNKAKGFDQNHNRGSMTFINCTGYGNGGNNYAIAETLDVGKTLTITNCAELGNKRSINAIAILTTNSWQLFTVTAADFVSVDTTGVCGQRKADGSLPDIDFMHLAQGSQLINAGTNVGQPYNGSAPDLGCFESNWPSGVNDENTSIVSEYKLFQNYPNPFNPSTKISFSVGTYSHTSLRVYDILGREVATLVNGMRTAGNYNVEWDGRNSAGQEVGSGIYFYQLRCGSGFTATRKMILMR